MLYCVSRLRGPDGNAWRAGFWPAGRMLDTPVLDYILDLWGHKIKCAKSLLAVRGQLQIALSDFLPASWIRL